MKTYLDCIPCFLDQALRAGRIATNDEKTIKLLLDEVGDMIKDIPMENVPPVTGMLIYKKIRETTGIDDPYYNMKKKSTENALSLYPSLKEKVECCYDSLLKAIRLAIAGNVIDFGVNKTLNLENEIEITLNKKFAINDYNEFKKNLNKAKKILYIGDNAGEAVLDKILIEELNKPVTYVVRGIPVINDVIYEDAIDAGIGEVADIISSGTTAPGTILNTCNDDFIDRFNKADMIISKGMGNYEALSEVNRSVFFLLKAKCKVIANDLGVQENDIVLKGINL